MRHLAYGWACGLNDLFVRFPYEKCTSLIKKFKTALKRRQIVKAVFREGMHQILDDIIENNVTFKAQGIGYQGGEVHMEAVQGEDFTRQKSNGKFKGVDFLESLFTGYQMYLYVHGKRDNFLHRRKYPIYVDRLLRDKLVKLTNEGKVYC